MYPADFGPIYTETNLSRFPVEPWNTASNLVFLVIITVFAYRAGRNWRDHPLIIISLPVLLVGFVGGTIYHATRSANLWLYLDFMPIIVLAVLAACYFWDELLHNRLRALLVAFLILALMRCVRTLVEVPQNLLISTGYLLTAAMIIIPAMLVARRDSWRNAHLIFYSFSAFALALFFRIIDSVWGDAVLPMGTHFLWHLGGGVAVYYLMEFVFRRELRVRETPIGVVSSQGLR